MRAINLFSGLLAALIAVVLPRYAGTVLFFLILLAVLGNVIGDDLGLSNIFRDSMGVQEGVLTWTTLVSPSFWTCALIVFASGVIMMFPCFDWLYRDVDPDLATPDEATRRRRLPWYFLGGCPAITAILGLVWWQADASPVVPGEPIRAGLGLIFGALMFAGPFWLSLGVLHALHALYNNIIQASRDANQKIAKSLPSVRGGKTIADWLTGRLERWITKIDKNRRDFLAFWFIAPTLAVVAYALRYETLIPAVALLCLLLGIYLTFQLFKALSMRVRIVLVIVVAAMFWAAFDPQTVPFKTTFDGIEARGGENHYADPLQLDPRPAARAGGCSPGQTGQGAANFVTAMNRWLDRQRRLQGTERPKLVIIATSGGAYRAAFWTGLVLDRLIAENASQDLAGLVDAVRFLTGASGGMIGAGYFAAGAGPEPWSAAAPGGLIARLEADILAAQKKARAGGATDGEYYYRVSYPVPRDSLSAISQHLIQTDLPSLLRPGAVPVDRGKILERHWLALNRAFDTLTEGEAQGWRPSIILSPMLIETGQPMLISNLDLSFLPEVKTGEMIEFFDYFPCARTSFALATAVRMSATFPYISPATSLPTKPARRVVDAGYYDNYGVALINALLSNDPSSCSLRADARQLDGKRAAFCFREWVAANTSGILLIEIRAFALETQSEPDAHCDARADPGEEGFKGFEFLTSPIDAVLSARSRTMVYRNEQGLRRLSGPASGVRVHRVIFVNCAAGTLNWTVPDDEMTAMRKDLEQQWPARRAELAKFWAERR